MYSRISDHQSSFATVCASKCPMLWLVRNHCKPIITAILSSVVYLPHAAERLALSQGKLNNIPPCQVRRTNIMVQVQLPYLSGQCLISNLETCIPHKCKVCFTRLLYGYHFNAWISNSLWEQLAAYKLSSSLLLCVHSTLPDHQFSTYTIYSSKRSAIWLVFYYDFYT